jgi:hypothetical protein
MHLSGFDVILLFAVPLAIFALGVIAWWAGMARYRRALTGEHRIAAQTAERRGRGRPPLPAKAVGEPAQPAPAPLAAGGSSESAVFLTP